MKAVLGKVTESLTIIKGLLSEDGYGYNPPLRRSKYDELIGLVDSDKLAGQVLGDTTYAIAGILNGGLSMMAESDDYYHHFMDSCNYLSRCQSEQLFGQDSPIGAWVSLMRAARPALRSARDGDIDVGNEEFLAVADPLENWLYNSENLEALASALIDLLNTRRPKTSAPQPA